MNEITVRVPATSANLGPGFDTLGLALSLYNTITIRANDNRALDKRVVVTGEGAGILATDESNLAYSSAQKLFALLEIECNFALEMDNEIPLSRGLGSSAAACVGGLVAANEWAKLRFEKAASRDELLALATQIEGHPDNACACLLGGFVVSVQSDERVFAVRAVAETWPRFAVWIPDEPLPTKEARAVVPQTLSRQDAVFNISRAALLVAALSTGDEDALREALHDRIHQTQRAPLIRGYDDITRTARENGAFGATLSGAGSTILIWSPQQSSTGNQIESAIKTLTRGANYSGRFLWLDVDGVGASVVR
ncbi:MAG TPA: homoserine kinase [Abditibacteriaceae bacterium]|nr:homoserine kinase [Abditibacteriaceae bacterium]